MKSRIDRPIALRRIVHASTIAIAVTIAAAATMNVWTMSQNLCWRAAP
jgi:hypothetical protein